MKNASLHFSLVVMPMLIVGAVSGYLLLASQDPQSFQRFGSIMVVIELTVFALAQKLISQEDVGYREAVSSELFVIILGTLQWGYGDLFHCWFNGNGWKTC